MNDTIITVVLIVLYFPVMGVARFLSAFIPEKSGWQPLEKEDDAASPY